MCWIEKIMKKLYLLVLFVLFSLSLTVRVLFVNDGLFHHDSVQLAKAVEDTYQTGVLHPATGGKYGLVLLYTIPYFLYHNAYVVTTFMTILFASLSVLMAYFLVKELFGNEFIALSSALMFSFSPLYLGVTTYAKSHAAAMFFLFLSFWLYVVTIKRGKTNTLFVAPLAYTLSLLIRIDNIMFFPMFLVLYLCYKSKKRYMLVFYLITALLMTTCYVWGLLFKYSGDQLVWGFDKLVYLLYVGLYRYMDSITTMGFCILVLSIFYLLYKKQDRLLLVCGYWILSIFIPMSMLNVSSARFYVPILLPSFVIISAALSFTRWKVLAATAIVLIMFLTITPVINFRHYYSSGKELGLYLKDNIPPDSYVMLGDANVFAEYYSNLNTIGNNADITGKEVYTVEGTVKDMNYSTEVVGVVLYEDYHHKEVTLDLGHKKVYRLIG